VGAKGFRALNDYPLTMFLEPVLLAVVAAAAGIAFRSMGGAFAERIGHTRREGEDAVGTAGLSLIVKRKPPASMHGQRPARHR
jgi:nitrate/nitrite transporter NarK